MKRHRRSGRVRRPPIAPPAYFKPGWGIFKYNGRETSKFHWMISPIDTLCRFASRGMLDQIEHRLTPLDEDGCHYCRRKLAALARAEQQRAEQYKHLPQLF